MHRHRRFIGSDDGYRKTEARISFTPSSTMPSTSKSNRRKQKKSKKLKQQWVVKQPKRNWLELPEDVMANILSRVGLFDILENAQLVCTAWHKICKEPSLWRVICLDGRPFNPNKGSSMWKRAVDRSQGQLTDLTMLDLSDELLQYAVNRSSQLRRLEVAYVYYNDTFGRSWGEIFKKFQLLEELNLYSLKITKGDIETAGRYCPRLKTLKLNQEACTVYGGDDSEASIMSRNEIAMTIGKNLHGLEHLELIGNKMSNIGLQAILDGCRRLKLLDLRKCSYIDLKGDVGKRCLEEIKELKLPNDSLKDCPYIYENGSKIYESIFGESDDDGCFEYDDFYDYDYDEYDDYVYDDYVHDLIDMGDMRTLMEMFDHL